MTLDCDLARLDEGMMGDLDLWINIESSHGMFIFLSLSGLEEELLFIILVTSWLDKLLSRALI